MTIRKLVPRHTDHSVGNKEKGQTQSGFSRKHSKSNFPKNKHFLPPFLTPCTHTHEIQSKKWSFFGKFGVLCFLETPVLRFSLLPYCRQLGHLYFTEMSKQPLEIFSNLGIVKCSIYKTSMMHSIDNFRSNSHSGANHTMHVSLFYLISKNQVFCYFETVKLI